MKLTIVLWLAVAFMAGNVVGVQSYNNGYTNGYDDGRSDRLCPAAPGEMVIPTPPYWRES
jgi:hypothetical protein